MLGKSVGLRTRYAYDCVLDRLSWDSPIWITHEAEGELRFRLENIEKMNFEGSYFSQLTVEACKANMFSDAGLLRTPVLLIHFLSIIKKTHTFC